MRVQRRVLMRATVLALAGAAALAGPAAADHGALDPLFGNQGLPPLGGGFTVVDQTTGDEALNDVVGLPDGRLFAAGRAGGFAVMRFTAAGRPDPAFSSDGLRVIGAAGGEAHAVGTAIGLPLLAAGTAPLPTQLGKVAFIRGFDAAGNNAAGLGSASSITISRGTDVDTAALAMAADPPLGSGTAGQPTAAPLIAVGGFSGPVGAPIGQDAWVAVVTSSGALARGGIRVFPHFDGPTSNDRVTDLAFTGSDRRLLVVGTSRAAIGVSFVAKIDAQGALDPAFGGGDGIVTGQFGCGNVSNMQSLTVDPQGRIIVAGTCGEGPVAISRLNPDGSFDTSFGNARDGSILVGRVPVSATLNASDITFPVATVQGSTVQALDVVRRADGSLVVAGSSVVNGVRRATAVGVSEAGNLLLGIRVFGDEGFAVAGPPNTSRSELAAITTSADGNLVAAGRAVGKSGQFLLVKYHAARDRARPTGTVRLLGAGRGGALAAGPVRLRLGVSEPVAVSIRVRLAGGTRVIARTDLGLSPRRTRTVAVPLTLAGRALLAGRSTARVSVIAVLEDVVGKTRTIRTTATALG